MIEYLACFVLGFSLRDELSERSSDGPVPLSGEINDTPREVCTRLVLDGVLRNGGVDDGAGEVMKTNAQRQQEKDLLFWWHYGTKECLRCAVRFPSMRAGRYCPTCTEVIGKAIQVAEVSLGRTHG